MTSLVSNNHAHKINHSLDASLLRFIMTPHFMSQAAMNVAIKQFTAPLNATNYNQNSTDSREHCNGAAQSQGITE